MAVNMEMAAVERSVSYLVEERCMSTEEVDETETEVYLWCSDLVEERRVSSEVEQ